MRLFQLYRTIGIEAAVKTAVSALGGVNQSDLLDAAPIDKAPFASAPLWFVGDDDIWRWHDWHERKRGLLVASPICVHALVVGAVATFRKPYATNSSRITGKQALPWELASVSEQRLWHNDGYHQMNQCEPCHWEEKLLFQYETKSSLMRAKPAQLQARRACLPDGEGQQAG